MKLKVSLFVILLAALAFAGCVTSSKDVLPFKAWHVSPTGAALARIPTVEWGRVQRIHIGMSETNAIRNLGVNASDVMYKGLLIVFSHTRGQIPVEVAFRLSEDKVITDISYRQSPD